MFAQVMFGHKRSRLSSPIRALSDEAEVLEVGPPAANDETIVCKVAGCEVEFLIDSGASINAITEQVYAKLQTFAANRLIKVQNDERKSLMAYATKTPLKVIATLETDLWIDENRPHGVEVFYVIQSANRSLLGRDTSIRYNVLQMGRKVLITRSKEPYSRHTGHVNSIASISKGESFPTFNLPPVKLNIDKQITPHRSTYSSIPPGWRKETNLRIEEMLRSGIIERVTQDMDTSHCSSLLTVAKGKDDFRLVVDLRGPNKCIIREPHKMPTLDSIVAKLDGAQWFSTIDLSNAFFHVELHEESRHVTNFFTGEEFYGYKRLPH